MNVVLVTRGANAWVYFLIDGLLQNGIQVNVVNERREMESSSLPMGFRKRRGWLAYLDLLLLKWITRIGLRMRRSRVGSQMVNGKFDPEKPLAFKSTLEAMQYRLKWPSSSYNWEDVAVVNSTETIERIRSLKPTFVILCGAPILKKEFVDSFSKIIINCHCGIAPQYRGSSPAFWAIYRNDLEHIGYTIHLVTYKLDAGPILYQERVKLQYSWTLEEIDWFLIVTMYRKLLELVANGSLAKLIGTGSPQEEGTNHYPMGYVRQVLTRVKLRRYYRRRLPDRQFWDHMAKVHHTTGTQDYIIASFDQRMRLRCVEALLLDYGICQNGQDSLLDFGCGSGDFIRYFAPRCRLAIGYDLSHEILRVAQSVTQGLSNVRLRTTLDDCSDRFSVVFSITVLQHILDDEELKFTLRRIASLCEAGAHLIALESFQTAAYPVQQPPHVRARDEQTWRSIFQASGFKILEMRNFYNPYLIACPAFQTYMSGLGALKTGYRLLRKCRYVPASLLTAIDQRAKDVLAAAEPGEGFVDTDSLSKFIVARKVSTTRG